MNAIIEAKSRLNVHDIWQRLNLPGNSRKNPTNSPFRKDRTASFSVSRDGQLFNDFATGDAGDAIAFLQLATGLDQKAAVKAFLQMAGVADGTSPGLVARPRTAAPVQPQRQKPTFPAMERGTAQMLNALAQLRNLSVDGLRIADERGMLQFAQLRGLSAWIVTDESRVNAQARRLDGGTWEHLADSPKAYTLAGSWAQWPVGITGAKDFPVIALTEGGPDLLAAFHFAHAEGRERDVQSVAMLGAMQRIHDDALPHFSGKRVRIFPHLDRAGRDAAQRWTQQLESVGATVDCFDLAGLKKTDGQPIEDLNDLSAIHADGFEDEREVWGIYP